MARGWESKSVEEQMAEHRAGGASAPADGEARLARAHRERQRQELELQREYLLGQRTSNPARRAALEAAVAEIEARLAGLP
jgi:hypothetical protein